MDKKKEFLRTVKFVLFSASAGIIEIGVFTALQMLTDTNYWFKYLVALVASVLWNFTLNRRFTFKSAGNVPVAMVKVAIFYAIFTPLTTIGGNILAEDYGVNDFIVTAINMLLNFVLEYLYDRFVVFGKTLDTNDLAKKEEAGEN